MSSVAIGSMDIEVYLVAILKNSLVSSWFVSSFEKAGRSVVEIGMARLLTRTVKLIAAF